MHVQGAQPGNPGVKVDAHRVASGPAKRPVASPLAGKVFMTPKVSSPPIKSPDQKRPRVDPEEVPEDPPMATPGETMSDHSSLSPEPESPCRKDLTPDFNDAADTHAPVGSVNDGRVISMMVACFFKFNCSFSNTLGIDGIFKLSKF